MVLPAVRAARLGLLALPALLRIDGDAFLEALTTAPPTASLLETVQGRLARTHPRRQSTFAAAVRLTRTCVQSP